MDFKSSKTKENLARSFAIATQDMARLKILTKEAERESYEYLSNFLNEKSNQKFVLANILYELIIKNIQGKEKINIASGYPFESKKLKFSLIDASEIEFHEGKNLFPTFEKIANDEGFSEISCVFKNASLIALNNYQMFSSLAQKFQDKKLFSSQNYTCSNCGFHKETSHPWKECPFCGKDKGYIEISFI